MEDLSHEELEELERALAEDAAGDVIGGEEFLKRLREPLVSTDPQPNSGSTT